jgi:hypothetical protein
MFQKVWKFGIFYFKNGQNRVFLPTQAIFFNLKIQSAEFLNLISSLDAKHKKKAKKYVGLASNHTLSGW